MKGLCLIVVCYVWGQSGYKTQVEGLNINPSATQGKSRYPNPNFPSVWLEGLVSSRLWVASLNKWRVSVKSGNKVYLILHCCYNDTGTCKAMVLLQLPPQWPQQGVCFSSPRQLMSVYSLPCCGFLFGEYSNKQFTSFWFCLSSRLYISVLKIESRTAYSVRQAVYCWA